MQLMIVLDTLVLDNGLLVLTGRLLLGPVRSRDSALRAFGESVKLDEPSGNSFVVSVRDVTMSGTFDGGHQVYLCIDPPPGSVRIEVNSVVSTLTSTVPLKRLEAEDDEKDRE